MPSHLPYLSVDVFLLRPPHPLAQRMAEVGSLDLRRKAQISRGKPTDHAADVIVRPSPHFDLDKTIFRSLDGTIARVATKNRLAIEAPPSFEEERGK